MDWSHIKKRRWRDINPQGNRKKNSWRRSVNKEAGRSWNELKFLAADRRKWKGIINNLCSFKGTMVSYYYYYFYRQ